jgi:hypothetical protein
MNESFRGNANYTYVWVHWDNPLSGVAASSGLFNDEVYAQATLIVPQGKKAAYQAVSPWNQFTTILELGYTFEKDGIKYSLNGAGTVSVVSKEGGYIGHVDVPATVTNDGATYTVTKIGHAAFSYLKPDGSVEGYVTSVTLPNTIVEIGDFVFWKCSNLTSITLPGSLTTIGELAFEYTALTTINIPASVTYMNDSFRGNTYTSVTVNWYTPVGVTVAGYYGLFSDDTYAQATLIVPKGTKAAYKAVSPWTQFTTILEEGTFMKDGILYSINDDAGTVSVVTKDGVYTGHVDVPATVTNGGVTYTVTKIGSLAFSRELDNGTHYGALTSITLPNSITSIGNNAFDGCGNLTSITIPNSIKSIANETFKGCVNMTSVIFPDSLESIGEDAFSGCVKLTSVTLPNSLKTIGKCAFMECETLTFVTIPNSVTYIGWSAFMGCSSLASVILPGSITHLGATNFVACSSLRTIEVGWDTPPNAIWYTGSSFEESVFHSGANFYLGAINFDYANGKLIVPPGTQGLYQGAPVWQNFGIIDEATLNVVPDTLSFGAGAADTAIVVESNILSWIVAGADWMTITGSPGIDTTAYTITIVDDDGLLVELESSWEESFTLAIAANDSTAREAKVIIASTSTAKVADTIVVIQAANPYINVSADSLFFDAFDSQDTIITVTAYSDWTVVKDTSWIVLGPKSLPPGSATGTFTVRTEDNDSTAREGRITITKGDSVKSIVVTQAANPYINVSADSLFFDAFDSQDSTVTVTAYIAWTAQKDSAWIILNPTNPSGNTPGTFTIAVSTNPGVARTGKVMLSNGTTSDTIYVTQQANPTFDVTPTPLTFAHNDTTTTRQIDVTCYVAWTAENDSAWIILDPATPSGNSPGTFTIAVATNPGVERTGKVVVSNGTLSDTIYVTQQANPTFNVTKTPLTFAHDDVTPRQIDVTCYVAWTAENDSAWIILDPLNPADSKPGNFTVAVATNPGVARTGKVIVSNGTTSDTIYVTQQANPVFSVPTTPLTFAYDDALPRQIDVTCYVAWTAQQDSSWIILDPANPSGNSPWNFTVAVATNLGVARTGKVIVSNGTTSDTIYVTQQANPVFNVTNTPLTFAYDDALPRQIDVTCYVAWTAANDSAWIILDPANPAGNSPWNFTVAVATNPGVERNGKVIVSNGTLSDTIYVTQQANPTFNVPTTPLTFAHNDVTTRQIDVTAYTAWTAQQDSSWIILNPANPADNKPGNFTIAVGANLGVERKGKVVVSNGTTGDTIYITQQANPTFYATTTPLTFGYNETTTTRPINVTAYTAWTANRNSSWIVLNPANPAGNSPGNFTIAVNAVNSGVARTGKVIVTNGTIRDTIYVTQEANPAFNVTTTPLTFGYDETTTTRPIDVTAYTAWTANRNSSWIVLNPANPAGNSPGNFTIAVNAVNSGVARTGKVIVTNGTIRDTIYVTQEANPAFNVTTTPITFGHDETTTRPIDVTAYTAWTATNDSAWIILNPTNPSGNSAGTFTIAVSTNPGVERTGKVTVTNGTETDTIYVTQQAKPQMTVSDESLYFTADPTDSQSVTITANVAWTVQVDLDPEDEDDWLSVTPLLGVGDDVLTVTAKVNTGIEREGTVTVSSGIADFVITVTQDAAATAAPHLMVSPESLSFKDNDPEVKTVTVTANVDWRVTVLPANTDWLILTPESPSAAGNDDFTVQVTYNSGLEREATITVAPTVGVAGVEPKTIRVTQDANGSGILLHPEILSFEANESTTKPVSVTVDGHYKVTAKDAWLTLDPEAPEGDDFGTFYVGAAENTGQERTGRIAVESADTSVIYYVQQSAAPYLLLSADTLYFEVNPSLTQGVSVTSNANWTVDVDVSWVTLSAESGVGSDSVYATATPNTGGERKGTITFRCSGKSYTIHVEQETATQTLRFKDGDLYYYTPDRYGTTVEVVNAEEDGYSGAITIPSTATDPETEKTYDVIRIGDRAFYNSASLTSVEIPSSVVEIGDRAFAYCSNLVSVEIPNSVEQIGEWAFSACTNLASVEIPASVKKIMNGAFSGCSKLNSVKIPSAVTNVACMAFYDCINLTAMHVYWDTPPNVSNINPDFSDYTHCTLYVPVGTKRDYQYAWYWANFVDIIERSATGTDEVTTESAVTAHASSARLYVDSPSAETIYVYSFTGKLLRTATKAPGKAEFDLTTREKLIIVRGSSGWARKLTIN